MKIYEFLILPEQEKYKAIWNDGVHIGTHVSSILTYQLYSLGDFYVEVHFNAGTNKVIGNLPFKHGQYLDKYLPNLK